MTNIPVYHSHCRGMFSAAASRSSGFDGVFVCLFVSAASSSAAANFVTWSPTTSKHPAMSSAAASRSTGFVGGAASSSAANSMKLKCRAPATSSGFNVRPVGLSVAPRRSSPVIRAQLPMPTRVTKAASSRTAACKPTMRMLA
eukprot:gene7062-159_t